jgi:hypothetical protein
MRWSELVKLACLFKMDGAQLEIADLTRFIIELNNGKLTNTLEKQNPAELSNSQIREKISDYMGGRSEEIPPILYADVAPKGKVKLYRNSKGRDVYLKLKFFGDWLPGCLAAIKFISTRKIEVTLYKRDNKDGFHSHKYEMLHRVDRGDKHTLYTPEMKPTMDISALPDKGQAKIIAAWIWDEAKLTRAEVKRKIGINSICRLCSVRGIEYKLQGIKSLYPKIEWVKAVEKEEEIDGKLVKTATLYPADVDTKKEPDKWFAVFWLPSQSYEGVLIKKKKPQ